MEIFPAALAESFSRVARRLRRETSRRIAPLGLNLHQSRALQVIGDAGPLRPSDLADRLGIAARSATDSVTGLVAAGLVRRDPDPADRRAHLLALSPAGEHARREVARIRTEVGAELFDLLDAGERTALAGLLARLDRDVPGPEAARP